MTSDRSLGEGWKEALEPEFVKPYFTDLIKFVEAEQRSGTVYPAAERIFAAFMLPLADVKVVILGQDPYHGAGQAMGLSFSVPAGVPLPPSLQNIFKEIGSKPSSGDLTRWVEQGVMLLNTTMTVPILTAFGVFDRFS